MLRALLRTIAENCQAFLKECRESLKAIERGEPPGGSLAAQKAESEPAEDDPGI